MPKKHTITQVFLGDGDVMILLNGKTISHTDLSSVEMSEFLAEAINGQIESVSANEFGTTNRDWEYEDVEKWVKAQQKGG